MYAILLHYTVPLERLDTQILPHREWLDAQYSAGHFLLSGPQEPRTGGLILAMPMDRAALDEILESDPFRQHNMATYQVIKVVPLKTDARLAFLREKA